MSISVPRVKSSSPLTDITEESFFLPQISVPSTQPPSPESDGSSERKDAETKSLNEVTITPRRQRWKTGINLHPWPANDNKRLSVSTDISPALSPSLSSSSSEVHHDERTREPVSASTWLRADLSCVPSFLRRATDLRRWLSRLPSFPASVAASGHHSGPRVRRQLPSRSRMM